MKSQNNIKLSDDDEPMLNDMPSEIFRSEKKIHTPFSAIILPTFEVSPGKNVENNYFEDMQNRDLANETHKIKDSCRPLKPEINFAHPNLKYKFPDPEYQNLDSFWDSVKREDTVKLPELENSFDHIKKLQNEIKEIKKVLTNKLTKSSLKDFTGYDEELFNKSATIIQYPEIKEEDYEEFFENQMKKKELIMKNNILFRIPTKITEHMDKSIQKSLKINLLKLPSKNYEEENFDQVNERNLHKKYASDYDFQTFIQTPKNFQSSNILVKPVKKNPENLEISENDRFTVMNLNSPQDRINIGPSERQISIVKVLGDFIEIGAIESQATPRILGNQDNKGEQLETIKRDTQNKNNGLRKSNTHQQKKPTMSIYKMLFKDNHVKSLQDPNNQIEFTDFDFEDDCSNEKKLSILKSKPEFFQAHWEYLKKVTQIGDSLKQIIESILKYFNEFFQAIVSVASCFIYVLTSYNDENNHGSYTTFLHTIEIVITTVFLLDYIHHLLHEKHKLQFIISIQSIVDLIIIVPAYINLFVHLPSLGYLHTFSIFRLVRIIRIYRLVKEPKMGEKINLSLNDATFSFHRQIGICICTLFVLTFISAAISYETNQLFGENNYMLRIYENNGTWTETTEGYYFLTAFYLIIQQLFLVSFNDVYPISASSRIMIMCFIILAIFVVIDQLAQLLEIHSKTSPWDFVHHGKNHNIIIGHFNEYSIWKFCRELYYDHKHQNVDTLMIHQGPPSYNLLNVIDVLQLSHVIKYLDGSIYHESIISRAKIQKSNAIFLMNDQFSSDSIKTDESIILMLKLMQDYAPSAKKYIQIIRKDNLKQIEEISNDLPWNYAICTSSIKAVLLAESLSIHGVIPFFGNLFTKFISNSHKPNHLWQIEYEESMKHEMYSIDISKDFHGQNFSQVVNELFMARNDKLRKQNGLLLIGIKRILFNEHKKVQILINPINYKIQPEDKGIVIASSLPQAKFLSYYKKIKQGENLLTLKENRRATTSRIQIKKQQRNEKFKEFGKDLVVVLNNITNLPKLENLHIKQTYVDLWKNSLSSTLKDHIIIIGPSEVYEQCMVSIRHRSGKTIVVLAENEPDYIWEKLATKFYHVIYAKGNMLNIDHLESLSISNASHVLIFSTRPPGSKDNDTNALLLANLIDEFYKVPYTIELDDQESIRYLKNTQNKESLAFQFWPKYMAGEVFYSSLLDSLMAMLQHNDTIFHVFRHLYQKHMNNFIIKDIDQVEDIIEENKELHLIQIPQSLIGAPYHIILEILMELDKPILPIGLYTKLTKDRYFGKTGASFLLPFLQKEVKLSEEFLEDYILITNPLPTTKLNLGDRLLILGATINIERNYERKTEVIKIDNKLKGLFEDHEIEEMHHIELKKQITKKDMYDSENQANIFPSMKNLIIKSGYEKSIFDREKIINELKIGIKGLKKGTQHQNEFL